MERSLLQIVLGKVKLRKEKHLAIKDLNFLFAIILRNIVKVCFIFLQLKLNLISE